MLTRTSLLKFGVGLSSQNTIASGGLVTIICVSGERKTHKTRIPNAKPLKSRPDRSYDRQFTSSAASFAQAIPTPAHQEEEDQAGAGILRALSRYRALVLDSSYRPIDVIHWQRALCLDLLDRADVLEYYSDEEATVCSVQSSFFLPAVLRTRRYKSSSHKGGSHKKIALNRRNIMMRDNFQCVYCGARKELTLDHVIPQSKGGENSWENLVTCCSPCNCKKGNKTLKELRWKLNSKPREPNPYEFHMNHTLGVGDVAHVPAEWEGYVFLRQRERSNGQQYQL